MKTRTKWIMMAAACHSLACAKMELSTGKKSKLSFEQSNVVPQTTEDQVSYKTWNSIEDYLEHLDELRKETADNLLARYRADGREKIRAGFRHFREAIAKEALREDSFGRWKDLNKTRCQKINQTDLLDLSEYGDLRDLLETSYLSRLQPEKASAFNPELSPKLDELTKLAFFEFGIAIEGNSSFESTDQMKETYADVRWKVIHEVSEPASLATLDERGVAFAFSRSQKADGHETFTLQGAVGVGVYEGSQVGSAPSMTLSYKRFRSATEPSSQSLELRKGLRKADGTWELLKVSRRIALIQDKAKPEELFRLIETINYGLVGEKTRTISVRLNSQEVCLDNVTSTPGTDPGDSTQDPGSGGSNPGPGGSTPSNPPPGGTTPPPGGTTPPPGGTTPPPGGTTPPPGGTTPPPGGTTPPPGGTTPSPTPSPKPMPGYDPDDPGQNSDDPSQN